MAKLEQEQTERTNAFNKLREEEKVRAAVHTSTHKYSLHKRVRTHTMRMAACLFLLIVLLNFCLAQLLNTEKQEREKFERELQVRLRFSSSQLFISTSRDPAACCPFRSASYSLSLALSLSLFHRSVKLPCRTHSAARKKPPHSCRHAWPPKRRSWRRQTSR